MSQPPNISLLAYSSWSNGSNRAPIICAGGGRTYCIRALHRKFDFEGRFIQAKMRSRGTPHSLKRLSLEHRNMRRGLATRDERRTSRFCSRGRTAVVHGPQPERGTMKGSKQVPVELRTSASSLHFANLGSSPFPVTLVLLRSSPC
jgi:hypothetical protein